MIKKAGKNGQLSERKIDDRFLKTKRNSLIINELRFMFAEKEGFEPPVPLSTTVFKTAAIDHSATSPKAGAKVFFFEKNGLFFQKCNLTKTGLSFRTYLFF